MAQLVRLQFGVFLLTPKLKTQQIVTKRKRGKKIGRREMDKGWRRPEGAWWDDFPRAQTEQAAMNLLASRERVGHQNRCRRR